MRRNLLNRLSLALLPATVALLMRLWFATCRVTEHGLEHRRKIDRGNSIVAVFWHFCLVYVFYHLKDDHAAVLVSASEDGEYIARLARCLNFETVRGSSNRRAMLALKELLVHLRAGTHVGMVGDGSQGPAQVAQAGSVLLASKSGAPILPMTWSASRSFTFNSWDHTCIPQPFSRIDFYYGTPIMVPPGIGREEIERYRLRLEEEMNNLYTTAWSQYGRENHYHD